MSSKQQQFLALVLLLSRGVGSVATAKITTAIEQAGLDDHRVGALLLDGKINDLSQVFGRHAETIRTTLETPLASDFEKLPARGQYIVCPFDPLLPSYYWDRAIRHRLPLIFIAQGSTPPVSLPWVAVIGSRNASEEGLQSARRAAMENTANGYVTVSGGAKGVDSAASSAAHQSAGMTVVVPAGDVSSVPCADRQLILSPYAPGTCFTPGLAMARNGVVVALSQSVVVAEVRNGVNGAPSGTQHAMSLAREYGVPIIVHQQR